MSTSAPKDSHEPVCWALIPLISKVMILPAKLFFPYWNTETTYCPSATTAVATGSEKSATQAVTTVPSGTRYPFRVAVPVNRLRASPASRAGNGAGWGTGVAVGAGVAVGTGAATVMLIDGRLSLSAVRDRQRDDVTARTQRCTERLPGSDLAVRVRGPHQGSSSERTLFWVGAGSGEGDVDARLEGLTGYGARDRRLRRQVKRFNGDDSSSDA